MNNSSPSSHLPAALTVTPPMVMTGPQPRSLSLLFFLILLTRLLAAPASSLSEQSLASIRFEQKLDEQLSLDTRFLDESGAEIPLANIFDRQPVILVLGYYECPMLCSLILNGLIKSLQELKLDPGSDFQIIMISIDPNESPDLAAAKKRAYLKRYGRSRSPAGWHFLTGTQDSITRVTTETGFHYAYDESIRQYAHPSGLIILTPQGRISRYIFGLDYPAKEVYKALNEAASGRIGSPIRQFILLCFHYQPLTGPYGALIMSFVRFGGVAMVLALAVVITLVGRRRPPPSIEPQDGLKTSKPGP